MNHSSDCHNASQSKRPAQTALLAVRVLALLTIIPLLGAANGKGGAPPTTTAVQNTVWRVEFSEQLYTAWREGRPMAQLSATHPDATLEDGYAIQQLFVARILADDGIGGFKAAMVSQASQDGLGIDGPLTAIIPASGVFQSSDSVVIDLSQDANRHVESEIGYVFSGRVTKPLQSIEALRQCVASIAGVIEVPGNPIEIEGPTTAADFAAWNINGKALIVGPRHDPAEIDADGVELTLTHNGAVLNTAKGNQAAGGQWQTLLKTVNDVVRRGYTVEAGHVITNGALGTIVKAEPGHYRADYGVLGVIEFDVK